MATKYSVFISSTYEDLKEERRAVQDIVIEAGDFPVQMESFPASDDGAFDLITSLLDQCDYYVLIIAGRYGKQASDGLSYTHKEYRYAIEKKIPVLVMLHGQRGQLPLDRTESTDAGRKQLEIFIEEVSAAKTRKTWLTPGDLKAEVLHALVNAKLTKPRVGWVRGDTISSVEALEELNEVRKENHKLSEALGQLAVEIPNVQLPSIDSAVEIDFLPNRPPALQTTRKQRHDRHHLDAVIPDHPSEPQVEHRQFRGRLLDRCAGELCCDRIGSCAGGLR